MQSTGQMVTSWPVVLGCDSSGYVVEVGKDVTKFKIGDGIYGCTRLGMKGHSTFQEFVSQASREQNTVKYDGVLIETGQFLMDEYLAFRRPRSITVEQAATIGVGLLVRI
jgi:NADPH:quinone reductase-like Zn-dependent oxidoreductase